MESRKIKRNPKRRNRGKSTEILKDGSVVHTYTASTAQAYTTSTARDICTLAVLCSVFVLWSVFRPFLSLHSQASQAQNTLWMPQLVYIENCLGKSPIVKKRTCVNNYLIWNKGFLPQMYSKLVSCAHFKAILMPFREVVWNRYSSF